MNKKSFNKPLLQAAAVIILGIILFLFVVNSESTSILAGLWAIISGIFCTLVYIVGILLFIAIFIAIFLGITTLISKEQSSILCQQIKKRLQDSWEWSKNLFCRCSSTKMMAMAGKKGTEIALLQEKIAELEEEVVLLREVAKHNTERIEQIAKKQEEEYEVIHD
ncbi:hypothetical protein [Desulfotalea psychrophila]|uniref:Uncharacterized protein n=1 Tax=Desulfotalea psychrophila (strain LSv54 / DSM 12343) TaxID=177439 RepID=Q6ANN8_DESPS|nr:hypothetical protein [Desulfotalea psychrophila]CAG36036.1 unknown protein [Desulfotalea psychrophila LSv54]